MPTELPTGKLPRPINPGTEKQPENPIDTLVDDLIRKPREPDSIDPVPAEPAAVPVR